MEKILENEGIGLLKSEDQYFLQYDAGELMIKIKNLPITPDEAKAVIARPESSYDIIIDYQDKGEFGVYVKAE